MKLTSKLWRTVRLGRITLALFILVVLVWIVERAMGVRIPGEGLLILLLLLALAVTILRFFARLARRFMWRLRNRLLVTYLLFGAVPLVLIFMMIALSFWVLCGQIAANMAQEEITTRTGVLYSEAHELALTTLYGMRAGGTAGTTAEFVRESRQRFPELRVVVRSATGVLSAPAEAEIQDIPAWTTSGYQGLIAKGDLYMIAAYARAQSANGTMEVLAYVPVDGAMLASFAADIGSVELLSLRLPAPSDTRSTPPRLISSERPLSKARGLWDQPLPWASIVQAKQLSGGTQNLLMTVTSRPSLIIGRVFRSLGTQAPVLGRALWVIGIIFLLFEAVSLIWSLRLARTITGTVYDLHVGTRKIEAGDFSHRIPIRTMDQLSDLGGSFNRMTGQIQRLIGEVQEKEKLQAELELARNVQSLLFPKSIPVLETLEIFGLCHPARVVSGDYYDFIRVNKRWTALVIGDISGKGVSAALLMASMQSALRAQIAADTNWLGIESADAPPTATMVSRLNRQLHESTSLETFASFFCAVYDDTNGRLFYTNAGHPPPVLIRNGAATRLEVNGMVMGFFPETPYAQDCLDLCPGDLFVAFTDGFTESENADGEQFGAERLAALLIENAGNSLDTIVETANRALREWAFDIDNQDDATMLLARRL